MNRNSTMRRFVSGLPGWREGAPGERVELGHWDVHKTGPNNAECDSWPRSCTNCLDNIWTYYKRVGKSPRRPSPSNTLTAHPSRSQRMHLQSGWG